jgi:hypothetical protein
VAAHPQLDQSSRVHFRERVWSHISLSLMFFIVLMMVFWIYLWISLDKAEDA